MADSATLQTCPTCGCPCTHAWPKEPVQPEVRTIWICWNCFQINRFDKDLKLEELPEVERLAMPENLRAYISQIQRGLAMFAIQEGRAVLA